MRNCSVVMSRLAELLWTSERINTEKFVLDENPLWGFSFFGI